MADASRQPVKHPELPLEEQGADYDDRFTWRIEGQADRLVMVLQGRVARGPRYDFVEAGRRILSSLEEPRVVVDLTACDHISSGALSYLVRFFKEATEGGGQVLGVGASNHVRGLMKLLGIDAFLLMVDDHAAADRYFEVQGG